MALVKTARAAVVLFAAAAVLGAVSPASGDSGTPVSPYVTGDIITTRNWPGTSLYINPGREFVETMPATSLLNGLGLNYSLRSNADHADAIALLASAGIKSLRIEINWSWLASDTGGLSSAAQTRFGAILAACAKNGITPTILLNANDQQPEPAITVLRHVVSAAAKGSKTVRLDNISGLVVGHSGLSGLATGWPAAGALFTSIGSDGTVTLSQPLPADIASGTSVLVDTLTHLPLTAVGSASYEDTSAAWLHYVNAVTSFVHQSGVPTFSVEVWNEITFGSAFLDLNNYYNPPLTTAYGVSNFRQGGPAWELARRTVAAVHASNPGVRVLWGFSSNSFYTTPVSGLPSGTDGQTYHPYANTPMPIAQALRPSDVSGLNDGGWLPNVTVGVPESIFALDLKPEELPGRLLSPSSRANSRPPGSTSFSQVMTEQGVSPALAGINDTATALQYKAIGALRNYTYWINKGVSAVDLYSAWATADNSWGALPASPDPVTYAQVAKSSLMTPELTAIQRLVASMHGAQTLSTVRQLGVDSVVSLGPETPVFTGDSSHPSLYYRDYFTFLPFQVTAHRFVVSTYVMSWNLVQRLGDMSFHVTISGVNGATAAASMVDPLTGNAMPVSVLSRTGSSVTLGLSVNDSPRLLTITD
jgi:hypothetical protein